MNLPLLFIVVSGGIAFVQFMANGAEGAARVRKAQQTKRRILEFDRHTLPWTDYKR